MFTKNSNDTSGNRTHDLAACSAVPQPTASPRAPSDHNGHTKYDVSIKGKERKEIDDIL